MQTNLASFCEDIVKTIKQMYYFLPEQRISLVEAATFLSSAIS